MLSCPVSVRLIDTYSHRHDVRMLEGHQGSIPQHRAIILIARDTKKPATRSVNRDPLFQSDQSGQCLLKRFDAPALRFLSSLDDIHRKTLTQLLVDFKWSFQYWTCEPKHVDSIYCGHLADKVHTIQGKLGNHANRKILSGDEPTGVYSSDISLNWASVLRAESTSGNVILPIHMPFWTQLPHP